MKRSAAERLYAALLWLHPPPFRRRYRHEILQHVRTMARQGPKHEVLLMTARDGFAGLVREWSAVIVPAASPLDQQANHSREPMRNLIRDLSLATRLLVRSPTFTLAAVVTLALGIGANTAIFTLAETVLLHPVRVRAAHELYVWPWSSSYPDFLEYRRQTGMFSGVAAVSGTSRVNLIVNGTAELTTSAFVSGDAFDVLGVGVAHGRLLRSSDEAASDGLVAVLGHDFWRSRLGSDPGIVGTTVRVNGTPVTIVGVVEPGFRGITVSSNPSLYLPVSAFRRVQTGFFARQNALANRGFVWLNVVPRLRQGVTLDQVNQRMTALYLQMHPRDAGKSAEPVMLTPLIDRALGQSGQTTKTFVSLLIAVVGLTLLVGCTNLANLLLARAAVRRREIGVRMALGASRGRIAQQMLTESLLLSALGGGFGLLVASATLRLLGAYELPGGLLIEAMGLEINRAAVAATIGLSLLTGLLFGIMPAWRAWRTDALSSLRDHTRSSTARSAARTTLLGAQVAICLILLTGTGLFARTLVNALNRPLGFNPDGVVAASVNVGLARYNEGRATALYAESVARIEALPQVASAAWASMIPTRGSWVQEVTIAAAGDAPVTTHVSVAHVGPGFFRTLGTRVVTGREFSVTDTGPAQTVAVINEAMARKYWRDRNPIGSTVGGSASATVIGVVENLSGGELADDTGPFVYFAFNQSLTGPDSLATDRAHLLVRSRTDAEQALPLIVEQLRSIDPELPLFDVEPFAERVAAMLMPQRLGLLLFSFFGTVATCLASIGIYGVASYVAAQRTREIGVRVALGASAAAIRTMVLREGVRPIATGIAVGLGVALYGSRLIEAFLFDVSRFDPATFLAVTLLLGVIALVASYIPAFRASRIDPIAALREE